MAPQDKIITAHRNCVDETQPNWTVDLNFRETRNGSIVGQLNNCAAFENACVLPLKYEGNGSVLVDVFTSPESSSWPLPDDLAVQATSSFFCCCARTASSTVLGAADGQPLTWPTSPAALAVTSVNRTDGQRGPEIAASRPLLYFWPSLTTALKRDWQTTRHSLILFKEAELFCVLSAVLFFFFLNIRRDCLLLLLRIQFRVVMNLKESLWQKQLYP